MKLIIQIPCFNEEKDVHFTINEIPNSIEGIKQVELLVINDGSVDATNLQVQKTNVQHIVDLPAHYGLGYAFKEGLKQALKLKADIIVNTDADNQYPGREIYKIIKPIIDGEAEIVIGDRQISKIQNYPIYKRLSQSIGNFMVSKLYHIHCKDTTSGFRAFTSQVAKVLVENLKNDYTYTLESICFLAKRGYAIQFVPIEVNRVTRKSRLITNKFFYVKNFFLTLFQYYLNQNVYKK